VLFPVFKSGKIRTLACPATGEFGLKAITSDYVTNKQIEAARKVIVRHIKKVGKIWIRIFPDKPITSKPAEVPMGSGKGSLDHFSAVVRPGKIIFEMGGIDESVAGFFAGLPALGALFLTPVFGGMVDKRGKAASIMMLGAAMLIAVHCIYALPFITSSWIAIVLMIVLGIAFSLVPSAMWPSVAKIFPAHQLGTAYALIFFIQNIGLWGIPTLIGIVLDKYCVVGKANGANLYDNQETFVPLTKEVEFIQNYIELMRIRVSSAVKINTNFQIRPDSQSPVAPLLFISLIENAFKHGISPTEPSFIDIMLTEKDDEIHCVIRNSNYPKNAMDKSGSGIGLEQVRKRLELLYAGRYEWHQQISSNQKEYSSILTIKIPDNNKKILP
jgi:ribosomal protein L16